MAHPDGPKKVYPPRSGNGELPVGGAATCNRHYRDGRLCPGAPSRCCANPYFLPSNQRAGAARVISGTGRPPLRSAPVLESVGVGWIMARICH